MLYPTELRAHPAPRAPEPFILATSAEPWLCARTPRIGADTVRASRAPPPRAGRGPAASRRTRSSSCSSAAAFSRYSASCVRSQASQSAVHRACAASMRSALNGNVAPAARSSSANSSGNSCRAVLTTGCHDEAAPADPRRPRPTPARGRRAAATRVRDRPPRAGVRGRSRCARWPAQSRAHTRPPRGENAGASRAIGALAFCVRL